MTLYLKHRPQDFNSLVGQEFIKNTLQKAIANEKSVGAYLLCGPRGTGKTSTARILAKALNCENQKDGNPCLECSVCKDFLNENLIDIIEIDAASHTGVDNIRDIIEKAEFKPSRTKYKVYIIDEVHMLSKGAFNALLKILEEPPEHVKFILATTETHKVPETIISRCQRYDFRRISEKDIAERMKYIAKLEKINIDQDSLNYIIKNSGGGLRNAISLFEQLIIDGSISYENIVNNLGLISSELLDDFLNKLVAKDKSIIGDIDNLIQEGRNMKLFFKDFIFFAKEKALIDISDGKNIGKLIDILDTLDETYSKTKHSLDENTTFLIGILKLLSDNSNGKRVDQNIKSGQEEIKIKETHGEVPKKLEVKGDGEDNIDIEEIGNMFGEPTTDHISVKDDFNLNDFIFQLKKLGAKGSLILGIRSASISINKSECKIKFKTSFALKSADTADNKTLLLQALSEIGYPETHLQLL